MKNVLSLANWNDCLNEFDEACYPGYDTLPLRHDIQSLIGHFNEASTSKSRKRCVGNKHASLWNIMEHGKPSQVEYSIHDSAIENRN